MAGKVADALAETLHTRVEIGRVQVGLLGRLIVDDVKVWDRRGKPMLFVTRTGVQMNVRRFIGDGDIIINSAQLFGAKVHLYQETPDSAPNFQFVLDAFASKDTIQKPLPHIEVRSILVRHTDLTYDKLWLPNKAEGLFDPNHLEINKLSAKASIEILQSDTIHVELNKLSFTEKCGFSISEAKANVTNGKSSGWRVDNLMIGLPDSKIESPLLTYRNNKVNGDLKANLSPNDFAMFYPTLREVDDKINLTLSGNTDKKNAEIPIFIITDEKDALSLSSKLLASNLQDSIPTLDLDIEQLVIKENIKDIIHPFFSENANKQLEVIKRMGSSHLSGHINMSPNGLKANLDAKSALGDVLANGTYHNNKLKAHIESNKFEVGRLLNAVRDSSNLVGLFSGKIDVDGNLKGTSGKPEGTLIANIREAQIKGYTYQNINASLTRRGTLATAQIHSKDPFANLDADFRYNSSKGASSLQGYADINNLDLHATHLSQSSRLQKLSAKIGVDFQGNKVDNMGGHLSIPHIIITDADTCYTLTNIQLISEPDGNTRHVRFTSPYATASLDGEFKPNEVGQYMQELAHNWLPDIFNAPKNKSSHTNANFTAKIINPQPLKRLTNVDLSLENGPLNIQASLNSDANLFQATAKAASVKIGGEQLYNLNALVNNEGENMQTSISLERMMKGDPIALNLNATTINNRLTTHFTWDNHKEVRNRGELALRGTMERNTENGLAIYAEVLPTEMFINDTLWNIHPSQLYFRDSKLFVDNFRLSMNGDERSLSINGTASNSTTDSIHVDLQDIDLAYIFTLARVKPLSLGGYATGRLTATNVFKNAVASGNVVVPHFLFNEAHMGLCNCYLAWGHTPGTLDIKGRVNDTAEQSHIEVDGALHLLKDPVQHMDMSINFQRANAAFLQRYVKGIMADFQGRASGYVHIYGKFKEIDLYGDVLAHRCDLTIPSLNVRYHAIEDSVIIRPGYVAIENITGYDRDGKPGMKEHSAKIDGRITYEHFKNMHYTFNIDGNNVLAYDQHDFGDMPFYATVWGTGGVKLEGGPGYVNIDIDATPMKGTTLTYNASSPETITQAGFVSFVDRSERLRQELEGTSQEEVKPTNDMNITFNLNLTPEAQLRLLMDPRTDDYISLYGTSRLRATYYNKGKFQMYGTYRVDHGTYKMTIQDVIHKDFQFRRDGTIVFGGNPFNADLGLQAVYTVPSVSLNDLTARGTFSNSTVRVNCIMNLGGKAGAPRVTFDFDIPNVNEDEARMVRSLISTEEERNMQVIYLLGIGRFYTYDYTANQTQGSTAMNSLLSSTLSGQLNQMLNNMTGNSNWNFGANLSTGTTGWSDMDVEGMLSGRLLNNRLLINGNFGYRDNPVAASNFIGDFDIQYLLTKNGNLVLKAYSETNDRYFTKSSLTTQGIGLLVKKDFNNLGELFNFLKRRKKASTQEK